MDEMKLEGITLLADDVAGLAHFYENVIGFTVTEREADYVAFDGGGKRLAIFLRSGMSANTFDHPSYREPRRGQSAELNFECPSPDVVREKYAELVERGAVSIAEPVEKPWGHVAGFFADPEGNIHSIFAVIAEG